MQVHFAAAKFAVSASCFVLHLRAIQLRVCVLLTSRGCLTFSDRSANKEQGGGGGPGENDTTGILVRSTATAWTKGTILAIDAGVHLSAIEDIVRQHLPNAVRAAPLQRARSGSRFDHLPPVPSLAPAHANKERTKGKTNVQFFAPVTEARGSRAASPSKEGPKKNFVLKTGPFADLMVPYESPSSIAAYMLRNLISTVVITHPHLDHLSGFAVNTAALGGSRKKIIAGLPKTIEAIRTHIFNDVIWPNMSDEDGGIGFVSYNRLVEGGHPALGDDDSSGYSEVCDGLEIKGRTVSHGHCMKQHRHRGSGSLEPASPTTGRRRSSRMGSYSGPPATSHGSQLGFGESQHFHTPVTASPFRCVIDSSAFFVRDEDSGQEILVFGDVEPDAISEEPRNFLVWADATPKIVRKTLGAIFIECSYDDSQPDSMLFGHLTPRWLIHELSQLARKVVAYRAGTPLIELQTYVTAATPSSTNPELATHPSSDDSRDHSSAHKKRRLTNGSQLVGDSGSLEDSPPHSKSKLPHLNTARASRMRPPTNRAVSGVSPMSSPKFQDGQNYFGRDAHAESHTANGFVEPPESTDVTESEDGPLLSSIEDESETKGLVAPAVQRPLEGLKVVIIHVKDPLKDDHDIRDVILRQCRQHEAKANLGCELYTCVRGDSFWV